jgi:hypothetical protein
MRTPAPLLNSDVPSRPGSRCAMAAIAPFVANVFMSVKPQPNG